MRQSTVFLLGGLALLACAAADAACAEQLSVTSGNAPSLYAGAAVQWDGSYGGSDCLTCDGAAGGFGLLTEGFIAPGSMPPLPYAGSVNTASGAAGDSDCCSVTEPSAATMDGATFTNPAWGYGARFELTDLTGRSIFSDPLGLQRIEPADWAYMNDAAFYAAIPEPRSLALFGAGLAGLAWLCRRRQPRPPSG